MEEWRNGGMEEWSEAAQCTLYCQHSAFCRNMVKAGWVKLTEEKIPRGGGMGVHANPHSLYMYSCISNQFQGEARENTCACDFHKDTITTSLIETRTM